MFNRNNDGAERHSFSFAMLVPSPSAATRTIARHPPQLSPRGITALSFKLLLRLPYGCQQAKQH